MNLLNWIKSSLWLQNLASWFASRIPPAIEHNLSKYTALRKAFYLTALDRVEGDYLEFGVFTGSSFIAATRMHQQMKSYGEVHTKFFGFDSFEGFGAVSEADRHPFYIDSIFRVNAERVIRNIKRRTRKQQTEIIPGFFEASLPKASASERGIQKSRIIFIDCDLRDPAKCCLDWVGPTLQPGTILILDDYFSYRGAPDRGVAGAFAAFQRENPQFAFREVLTYGYGGAAFIVASVAADRRRSVSQDSRETSAGSAAF